MPGHASEQQRRCCPCKLAGQQHWSTTEKQLTIKAASPKSGSTTMGSPGALKLRQREGARRTTAVSPPVAPLAVCTMPCALAIVLPPAQALSPLA